MDATGTTPVAAGITAEAERERVSATQVKDLAERLEAITAALDGHPGALAFFDDLLLAVKISIVNPGSITTRALRKAIAMRENALGQAARTPIADPELRKEGVRSAQGPRSPRR